MDHSIDHLIAKFVCSVLVIIIIIIIIKVHLYCSSVQKCPVYVYEVVVVMFLITQLLAV